MLDDYFKLENTYADLPQGFSHFNKPSPVTSPSLIFFNEDLAGFLTDKVDFKSLDNENLAQVFSGNKILSTSRPLSAVYSGHQFGHFSSILGDGRAHLLGEIRAQDQKLYDLQLKGSGTSAFSRSGDGRSPLGPALREYIVSEAMNSFGVETTRSLALVATNESVYREEELAGGVLTRVSRSLIRVGNFEYFASRGDKESLNILIDYVLKREGLCAGNSNTKAINLFKHVMLKQVKLVAKWMSLGFIHGVMNTDNTSISGLTIDYGPCAFLDETDFKKVFSFIDRNGRYSYSNQPLVLKWNLTRFAEALLVSFPKEEVKSIIPVFEEELEKFDLLYEKEWLSLMLSKIGLSYVEDGYDEDKKKILNRYLDCLNKEKADFTLSFIELGRIIKSNFDEQLLVGESDELKNIFLDLKKLIKFKDKKSLDKSIAMMERLNPIYIPRNHLIEESIQDAYRGNYRAAKKLIDVLKAPFTKMSNEKEHIKYSQGPKENEKIENTFCGT